MRYHTLPQIEERFRTEAANFLKPFSLPVPGEPSLMLNGVLYSPPRKDYFYPTQHPKERIVLHFTAGNVRSDMMSLTQASRHVSVAFVIARDGTIYQLFPSAAWSGHIGAGVGNQGTGNSQDKSSIGIEISNYGYLVPQGNTLETIYSRLKNPQTGAIGAIDPYCSLDDKEAYQHIDTPFRGQTYYATCTPQQVESTIILLRYLTAKYNIPRQFLPADKRFITTNDVVQFKGIVSHINYRSSGKWDIGPAFDWDKLIAGVQAPAFSQPLSRSALPTLTSEEAINALFPISKEMETEKATTDNEGYNPNEFEDAPLQSTPETSSGKLLALLVGINEYQTVRPLYGCVHDVLEVDKYLARRTTFETDSKILVNDEATRQNIISGFREHLSKAKKGDTVLFYYSGHGTQELADPIWEEMDNALECIVCYDGGTTKSSDFLLANKELRYLLHELYQSTSAHIVTIFDCCHSGSNTRGALIKAAFEKDQVIRRQIDGAFPKRDWQEFIFADALPYTSIEGKKPAVFLPEGRHIQMAACEDHQTSIELNGEGVFTKRLINVLEATGGNISYNTLWDRIRQSLRFTYEQTPRIYAPKDSLSLGFLNQQITPNSFLAEAGYNDTNGWQLNIGAIHGLSKDSEITITDAADAGKTYTATISEIYVDFALIDINGQPDKTLFHKTIAKGILTEELILELNNQHGNPKEMEAFLAQLTAKAEGHFEFASSDTQAPDYTLHVRAGDAVLTRPGDPYRPVTRPVPMTDDVVNTLQHISKWHFIKKLQNKALPAGFPAQPLKIEVESGGKKIDTENGTAVLHLEKVNEAWEGYMRITLTNTTKQPLFVSAIYLNNSFWSMTELLPEKVAKLEAEKSITLNFNGQEKLPMSLDDFIKEYNWPVNYEHIQFIVSTERFNVTALELDELPKPYVSADIVRSTKHLELNRGGLSLKPVTFKGWITQRLDLQFINPEYNTVDESVLAALLDYEETAFFAAGLYYDVELDEYGQPTLLKLKEGIKVPPNKKSLISDIKLWLGNKIETTQRRKLYRRLKKTDRLRIVAEGDSWFQYPILVKDTLDHLYKIYAVRSFAEAGDTLENYMKRREYLDAIKEEDARFFLVSGGGNDILGKQFREFLRETPDTADNTPKRFLKENFFVKLKDLENWYVEMFTELLQHYPDLHILSHSYDFIIPVDTVKFPKKTSWLGVYMIEKKIDKQEDREALITFMVNEFNTHLQNALNKFPDNTTYIDARGTVNRDSWFDEIHPTDAGFSLVADKFITKIENLRI